MRKWTVYFSLNIVSKQYLGNSKFFEKWKCKEKIVKSISFNENLNNIKWKENKFDFKPGFTHHMQSSLLSLLECEWK